MSGTGSTLTCLAGAGSCHFSTFFFISSCNCNMYQRSMSDNTDILARLLEGTLLCTSPKIDWALLFDHIGARLHFTAAAVGLHHVSAFPFHFFLQVLTAGGLDACLLKLMSVTCSPTCCICKTRTLPTRRPLAIITDSMGWVPMQTCTGCLTFAAPPACHLNLVHAQ